MYRITSLPLDSEYSKRWLDGSSNRLNTEQQPSYNEIVKRQNEFMDLAKEQYHLFIKNIGSIPESLADNLENVFEMDTSIGTNDSLEDRMVWIISVSTGTSDIYLGHVYSWRNPEEPIISIVGIRTSIDNILNKKHRGIGCILIDAIVKTARNNGLHVRVDNPFDNMRHILSKYGFGTYNSRFVRMSDEDIKDYDSKIREMVKNSDMIIDCDSEGITTVRFRHKVNMPVIYSDFFNTNEYTIMEIPKYEIMTLI